MKEETRQKFLAILNESQEAIKVAQLDAGKPIDQRVGTDIGTIQYKSTLNLIMLVLERIDQVSQQLDVRQKIEDEIPY